MNDDISNLFRQEPGRNSSFSMPESLSKMAERFLEAEIVEGRLPGGAHLNPDEIAKRLNISKSPVREAIILLQREGLITAKPRSVFIVSDINLADLREIYPIRASLNALAVKTIMHSPSAATIVEKLAEYLEQMRSKAQVGDTLNYLHSTADFYNYLISSCPNQRLQVMWHKLSRQVLRFRFLVMSQPGHIAPSLRDHARLIAAMRAGKINKAMRCAEDIIYSALAELSVILESREMPPSEH